MPITRLLMIYLWYLFNMLSNELAIQHSNLYNSDLFYISLQCTIYPRCTESRSANELVVREYVDKYGKLGTTFSCLFNPTNPQEVIRTRRFTVSHAVHGILWSTLIFVISLAVLICAVRRKGCNKS